MSHTEKNFVLNPKTTALVLIDLQQDIVSIPTKPLTANQVIDNANRLIQAFHQKKEVVVFVRAATASDGKDILHPKIDKPLITGSKPPKESTDIAPELDQQKDDLLITKHQWGAFYGTDLDLQFRRRGKTNLVLGGIATNFGVESTAREAYDLGYQIIFAADAMSSLTTKDHNFAINRIFPRIGLVRNTTEIITALHTK